ALPRARPRSRRAPSGRHRVPACCDPRRSRCRRRRGRPPPPARRHRSARCALPRAPGASLRRRPCTDRGRPAPTSCAHYAHDMQVHVADHPLISHKLTVLRNERTDSPTFRRLTEELVTLLAYEATRDVRVEPVEVRTPVAAATGVMLTEPRP